MAKPGSSANYDVLSIDDVADLLMVSDRTIRNWLKEREMPSTSDERGRRFEWSRVLPWYVKMKAEEDGNGRKSAPSPASADDQAKPKEKFDQALTRKTIAEADLKELELAGKRRLVVAVADAGRAMQDTAAALRTEILGWPTVMIGRVFGVKDRNQLFSILTGSARDLCTRLSKVAPAVPELPIGAASSDDD